MSLTTLTKLLAAPLPYVQTHAYKQSPAGFIGQGCPLCSLPHSSVFLHLFSISVFGWAASSCIESRAGSQWLGSPKSQQVLLKGISTDHLGLGLWTHPFVSKLLCRWARLRVTSWGISPPFTP